MKAYIQQSNNEWINVNAFSVSKGLNILGYDIVPFQAIDAKFPNIECKDEDIVFGGIPVVLDAMNKMGIEKPPTINFPDSLKEFLGRRIEIKSLSEIRQMANEIVDSFFIKPYKGEKDFTGFVFKSFIDLLQVAHVSGEDLVWFGEVVDFISEYRVYYLNNEIIGCKNYYGDSLVFPDADVIRNMFDRYSERFVAGSIDVGITSDGKTLLVEVNDAYSLGNYGIGDISYSKMIVARWDELKKRK